MNFLKKYFKEIVRTIGKDCFNSSKYVSSLEYLPSLFEFTIPLQGQGHVKYGLAKFVKVGILTTHLIHFGSVCVMITIKPMKWG